jgi:hypothetical protein
MTDRPLSFKELAERVKQLKAEKQAKQVKDKWGTLIRAEDSPNKSRVSAPSPTGGKAIDTGKDYWRASFVRLLPRSSLTLVSDGPNRTRHHQGKPPPSSQELQLLNQYIIDALFKSVSDYFEAMQRVARGSTTSGGFFINEETFRSEIAIPLQNLRNEATDRFSGTAWSQLARSAAGIFENVLPFSSSCRNPNDWQLHRSTCLNLPCNTDCI